MENDQCFRKTDYRHHSLFLQIIVAFSLAKSNQLALCLLMGDFLSLGPKHQTVLGLQICPHLLRADEGL